MRGRAWGGPAGGRPPWRTPNHAQLHYFLGGGRTRGAGGGRPAAICGSVLTWVYSARQPHARSGTPRGARCPPSARRSAQTSAHSVCTRRRAAGARLGSLPRPQLKDTVTTVTPAPPPPPLASCCVRTLEGHTSLHRNATLGSDNTRTGSVEGAVRAQRCKSRLASAPSPGPLPAHRGTIPSPRSTARKSDCP